VRGRSRPCGRAEHAPSGPNGDELGTKPKPLFRRESRIQTARRVLISPGERGGEGRRPTGSVSLSPLGGDMVAIFGLEAQPYLLASIKNKLPINHLSGAPERIRTSDPQIRSLVSAPSLRCAVCQIIDPIQVMNFKCPIRKVLRRESSVFLVARLQQETLHTCPQPSCAGGP
jgi:hypothetical protein